MTRKIKSILCHIECLIKIFNVKYNFKIYEAEGDSTCEMPLVSNDILLDPV